MGLLKSLVGWFSSTPPAEPAPTKPEGSDGVSSFGGLYFGGGQERHPALAGAQKWTTYDNAVATHLTVAAMARVWGALLAGTKWCVEESPRGGRRAVQATDLVREGLIDARMDLPWGQVVAKAGFGAKFRGFAIFEQVLRRRSDGRLVTARLDHRPQHTIARWDKPDEHSPWRGAWQETSGGGAFYLHRERLLYVVDSLLGDTPDGVGVLRHLVEPVERYRRFDQLEGWGFEFSLHGIPVARVPIASLVEQAAQDLGCDRRDKRVESYVRARIQSVLDFASNHARNPELALTLDSAPYLGTDEKRSVSSVPKWDFQLLTSAAHGQREVRSAMEARDRAIARLLGAEWLLMGDGEGARSVHVDKTTMFGAILNGTLEAIGAAATAGPAARICRLNGLDPDDYCPRVYPEPPSAQTVLEACEALAAMARAGVTLGPDDRETIGNALLERLRLPKLAELPDEIELPRAPVPGTPPDPAKGEQDVQLDDEEPPAVPPQKRSKR
jgi:hypothetical protein